MRFVSAVTGTGTGEGRGGAAGAFTAVTTAAAGRAAARRGHRGTGRAALQGVLDIFPDDPAVGARARTWARSKPASVAILRASGVTLRRPPETSCGGVSRASVSPFGGTTSGAGAVAAGARDGAGAAPPPSCAATCCGSSPFLASTRTRCPSAISSPSLTSSSATVPSSNDSIGMTALSVWISARVSPSLTGSPTFTSHWTSWPLSIVGLSLAIFTSMGMDRISLVAVL